MFQVEIFEVQQKKTSSGKFVLFVCKTKGKKNIGM